jgi:hypothetical protein
MSSMVNSLLCVTAVILCSAVRFIAKKQSRSRKLRFPDFMTAAQDKFVSLTNRPPLPPENTPGTRFC